MKRNKKKENLIVPYLNRIFLFFFSFFCFSFFFSIHQLKLKYKTKQKQNKKSHTIIILLKIILEIKNNLCKEINFFKEKNKANNK